MISLRPTLGNEPSPPFGGAFRPREGPKVGVNPQGPAPTGAAEPNIPRELNHGR